MAFTPWCSAHELPRGLNDGSPRRSCSFFTTRRAILQAAASSGISTIGVAAYPGIVRWNEIGCASPLGGPTYARSRRGLATRDRKSELQSQSNFVCRLLLEKKN